MNLGCLQGLLFPPYSPHPRIRNVWGLNLTAEENGNYKKENLRSSYTLQIVGAFSHFLCLLCMFQTYMHTQISQLNILQSHIQGLL